VLDAGCGAGGTCIRAAQRGAEIDGLDFAEGMIRVARERLPNARFRVGDIQALPYEDGSFDVIISANAVQFVDAPVTALREMGRVCHADGRVVIGIWGRPEENEYFTLLQAVLALLPSPPTKSLPWALSAPGLLERMIAEAGLNMINQGSADCPFEYPDDETFWRALGSSGLQQMVARTVGEGRVKAAMFEAVTPYRERDGRIRMENRMRYITATP
jgi:SAM-dependent methyltransferase